MDWWPWWATASTTPRLGTGRRGHSHRHRNRHRHAIRRRDPHERRPARRGEKPSTYPKPRCATSGRISPGLRLQHHWHPHRRRRAVPLHRLAAQPDDRRPGDGAQLRLPGAEREPHAARHTEPRHRLLHRRRRKRRRQESARPTRRAQHHSRHRRPSRADGHHTDEAITISRTRSNPCT